MKERAAVFDRFDATMRESAIQENSYLRTHDFLTNTYNRIYLDREYARTSDLDHFPRAVIACDINGLKRVNEALERKLVIIYLFIFRKPFKASSEQGLLSPHRR